MKKLLWLGLLAAGCSKGPGGGGKPGGGGGNWPTYLQQTLYDTSGNTSVIETQLNLSYQYNNSGQETVTIANQTEYSGGNPAYVFVDTSINTFSPSLITQNATGTLGNTRVAVKILYYLDAAGTGVDSLVTSETDNGVAEPTTKAIYTYGSNPTPIEIDNYENGVLLGKVVYTYSGRDVTLATTETPLAQSVRTDTYTYGVGTGYFDLTSVSFSSLLLRQAVDLPKTQTTTINGVTTVVNFAYTFDSQNRITGITATSGSGKLYEKDYNVVY